MRNKILALLLILSQISFGQNTTVQTFTYESTTRDTVVEFPQEDHNNWERIWMHYSMRCKDGLVSTGSNTNLGCGEWDYSCNTYIVDSTQVDSVMSAAPSIVIYGFSGDEFEYTNSPTYSYYRSTMYTVEYTSVDNEEEFGFYAGNETYHGLSTANQTKQLYVLISAEDLTNAGMSAGPISGLKLDVLSGSGEYSKLTVEAIHLSDLECVKPGNFTRVYRNDFNIDSDNNKINFYQDFEWDGVDEIYLRISFEKSEGNVVLNGVNATEEAGSLETTIGSNNYVHSSGKGYFSIENGLETIENEITISFWHYGDETLPRNTTLLEGVDGDNRRQVNIHLPWSNGQVYWDCGNVGGYDRINALATEQSYKGKWNHWAFTKNASTGEMHIYLNGELFHSGFGLSRPITLTKLHILSDKNKGNKAYCGIDDLSIWNTELTSDDIKTLACVGLNEENEEFENVIAYYDFNGESNTVFADLSNFNNDAIIEGAVSVIENRPLLLPSAPKELGTMPSISLVTGDYVRDVSPQLAVDSILNVPYFTEFYSLNGTDLVVDSTDWYYAAGNQPIYDETLNIFDFKSVETDGTLTSSTLNYYRKSPMQLEIMSFVTPYGINLDLDEGKTWTFDVTDFGPILKGNRRIYLSRGGQWQEDMDIKFEFVEGTPSRPVHSLQQIWPVTSENYQTIQADSKFEPRYFNKSEEDAYVVTKTTITGHGQEGEFIPRSHFMSYAGFKLPWTVWKECADNPIYPQGGTWVYDRAGWCPGAASDTRVEDITFIFPEDEPLEIDYGVEAGSGDSRYIVSSQLVRYGEASFGVDAAMEDIVYPSEKIEHGRFNPNCGKPKVTIKNNGIETLKSATIVYGIEGKSSYEYEWSGNLDFLQTQDVTLDYISDMSNSTDSQVFFARIETSDDEYSSNNNLKSSYTPVDNYGSELIIQFRTNNAGNETAYRVFDEQDNLIHSVGPGGIGANSTYIDTLTNLEGCYKIYISDSDEDGLSWWANNDGNGYVRLREPSGGGLNVIATDFGKFIDYNFVAGNVSSIADPISETFIDVFPNPSRDILNIIAEGFKSKIQLTIYDELGQVIAEKDVKGNGYYHIKEDISKFTNGIYILVLNDGLKSESRKFVKF